jgi:hypothetical protein
MIGKMRSIIAWVWPYRMVRIGLAALFIYGGVIKLIDPRAFARTISGYDLVPEMLLPAVAVGLPIIEAVAGIGLLLDIRGSLTAIASLLGLFVLVLGYGITLDINVDCGCFGAEDLDKRASLVRAFWRDVVLGGLVVPYLYLSRGMRSGSSSVRGKLSKDTPTAGDNGSSDHKKENQ